MLDLRAAEQMQYERVREVRHFNEMAEGRELRMVELRIEVNKLCEQAGIEPRYDTSLADEVLMDRESERRRARQRELRVEVDAGDGVPC